ncbi:MAG TPA: acyl-CoA thioesterase [Novosphingobium sp.]|nr:acyl-CoA thioesterase [Novosphingobium sp.]
MANSFSQLFTAGPEHIDVLGHVNNAVWVQWMEAIATAHWESDADPDHVARYVWVVTRHEIDYRGNIAQGQAVRAQTWIDAAPQGARFDRRVDFYRMEDAGATRPIVSARTTWAMIDRESGRLARVPADVAAPFMP